MMRQDGVKESSQARRYELMLEALRDVLEWDEHTDRLPVDLHKKVFFAIREASKTGGSE